MSRVAHVSNQQHPSQPISSRMQRLTGLDLFRGIAALAVVLLHADESIKVESSLWSFITQFSAFAVPFFLAASFYLTLNKLCNSSRPYHWSGRFTRLLIPFYIWCVLYSGWAIVKLVENGKRESLQPLLHQFPSLFILGKAGFAFHLYFIPLLLVGTILLRIIYHRIRQPIRLSTLVSFVIISLIIYQANSLLHSQDLSNLDQPLFDFALVPLAYLCRCLPYIAISLLLIHPKIQTPITRLTEKQFLIPLILFFIGVNAFDLSPFISSSLYEMLRAYSALLLAFALSSVIKAHPLITSISLCSFGIYLSHLIIVQVLWSIWSKLGWVTNPVPVAIILAVAVLSFGISWAITASLHQQKHVARLLFGS